MAIDYRKLTALRGPSTAGLLAALVVVLVGWALDRAETERYCSETRADIRDRLSSARAHIEGLLNRRLYLVRALQAYVVNNPAIDQDEFAKFAEILMAEDQSIRSMTLIKDNVISHVYPYAEK
jgi:sensor domain CHASE-containing protein